MEILEGKNVKKAIRTISVFLCLILLTGLIPWSALAAEPTSGLQNFVKEKELEEDTFFDVALEDWFYLNVQTAYAYGLMEGKGAGAFDPNGHVTLAETITVADRIHGIYYANGDKIAAGTPWYAPYVAYAQENGILKETYSDYQRAATREEFAVILGAALPDEALPAVNTVEDGAIPDVEEGASYYEAVYRLYRAGILTGNDSQGTFDPQSQIRRSEVAAIVSRMADSSLRESVCLAVEKEQTSTGSEPDYPVYYTVKFESNGGEAVARQQVRHGQCVQEPAAPARENYVFEGWYADPMLTERYDFTTPVNRNMTLYAKWSAVGIEPDAACSVRFSLNDGSDGLYLTQIVAKGSRVTKPEDPVKAEYGFTGWYLEPGLLTEYSFDEPVSGSMTLYAGWGAPDGSDGVYGTGSGGGTVYSVSGLEVRDQIAYATINVNSTSLLLLEILDEEDFWEAGADLTELAALEPLARVAAQTPEYGEMTVLQVPLEVLELPDYYVIRATLIDETETPLCNAFYSIDSTKKYEEFLSRSIEDYAKEYGEEQVIAFDAAKENFGVLKDTVKHIQTSAAANTLTLSERDIEGELIPEITYVFSNYDATVAALEIGDVVYALSADGFPQLFKIGAMDVTDETVSLKPDSEAVLTDFYDVLRADLAPQEAAGDDQVQLMVEVIDVDTTLSKSLSQSIIWEPVDWLELGVQYGVEVDLSIKMTYDFHLFGEDYFYCSMIAEAEAKVDFSIKAEANNDDEVEDTWEFAKISIPTPVPGLTAYVLPSLPIEWKISVAGTLELSANVKSGFTYDTHSGYQTVDKKSYSHKLMIEGEAEIKAGPKLAIGVAFLEKVVKGELSVQAGGKVNLTTEVGEEWTNAESKHGCTLCLDGQLKWFVEAKAVLTYQITKHLKGTPIDFTIVKLEGPIKLAGGLLPGRFYISVINDENSILHGDVTFGVDECPNKEWRVIFTAEASDGTELSDIPVELVRQNGEVVASGATPYTAYLYDGIYTVRAEINGSWVSKTVTVTSEPKEVVLTANSADAKLVGTVVHAETGSALGTGEVVAYQGSQVINACDVKADGTFELLLPEGTTKVCVSASGYITSVIWVRAVESVTVYETFPMIPSHGNVIQNMGGFSGRMVDASSGEPIDSVTLKVRNGWNAPETEAVLQSVYSDEDGCYSFTGVELFNVLLALPAGNYTLTASRSEYETKSFNITVLPGVRDNPHGDEALSRLMSEGTYRIVLSWGQDPRDLDSHLVGSTSGGEFFHVYYADRSASDGGVEICNLDRDDVDSYGPETITLNVTSDQPYYYYIYHFAGESDIAHSGARIAVYDDSGLIATYNAPTDQGSGLYWNVFAIVNGRLVTRNTITSSSDITYANVTVLSADADAVLDTSAADRSPKN